MSVTDGELLEVAFEGLHSCGEAEGTWFEPWDNVTAEQMAAFEARYEEWKARVHPVKP